MKKNKLFIVTSDFTDETPYVLASSEKETIKEFIKKYTQIGVYKCIVSLTHKSTYQIEYEAWIPDFRKFQIVTRTIKIAQLQTM